MNVSWIFGLAVWIEATRTPTHSSRPCALGVALDERNARWFRSPELVRPDNRSTKTQRRTVPRRMETPGGDSRLARRAAARILEWPADTLPPLSGGRLQAERLTVDLALPEIPRGPLRVGSGHKEHCRENYGDLTFLIHGIYLRKSRMT